MKKIQLCNVQALHSIQTEINGCTKGIAVFYGDITSFHKPIDILTTSAFVGS